MVPGLLVVFPPGIHVAVSNLQPEIGFAYIGKLDDPTLSDDKGPTRAALYLIESRAGSFFSHWPSSLGQSYAFSWLKALFEARFPTSTYEIRIPLGPGQSLHQDIRDKGDGRYSVWQGYVYFSLPAGISLANVKALDLVAPGFFSFDPADAMRRADEGLVWGSMISAACLGLYALTMSLRAVFRRSRIAQNAAPGIAVTVVLCVVLASAGEVYLRLAGMFPKQQSVWPSLFIENVGFVFQPGATVKYTNGVEFWVEDRVNSLGFLDREPAIPKPPGTFRVLLIGDSFVEAAQVPLKEKLQTLLAAGLESKFPNRKYDVVAMGYSGTGQANQLTFYERSRTSLSPDVVILLFVGNDFANNSPLLEGARNGWDPQHVPRLFMHKTKEGQCSRLPIVSDWQKHVIAGGTVPERAKQLRAMSPEYNSAFADWDATKEDIDTVFYHTYKLPPAFEEAVDLTKCALQEWQTLAKQDGFSLIVAATENVATRYLIDVPETRGQIFRLQRILNELQIPLLDLHPEFAKRGDLQTARWKFDGHWSPAGHRWAADSILQFLMRSGLLNRPRSVAPS